MDYINQNYIIASDGVLTYLISRKDPTVVIFI